MCTLLSTSYVWPHDFTWLLIINFLVKQFYPYFLAKHCHTKSFTIMSILRILIVQQKIEKSRWSVLNFFIFVYGFVCWNFLYNCSTTRLKAKRPNMLMLARPGGENCGGQRVRDRSRVNKGRRKGGSIRHNIINVSNIKTYL